MSTFQRNPRFVFMLGALSVAAALAACGGGDDPASPLAETPPAEVVSLDYTQPGSFSYTAYVPDGTPSAVPVTVTYNGSVGTLTLKAAGQTLVASTADAWAGVTWSAGYAGLLALGGNASLVCKTVDNTGQVGISSNLIRVTDLAELRGKTFQFKTCANGAVENDGGIVFNADGSAQFEDADGDSSFDAATVADYFSEDGWLIEELIDGSKVSSVFKALAFYRTAADGTKQYVILDISNDVLTDGSPDNTVSLMVEVQATK